MRNAGVPRLAQWLVKRLTPEEDRSFVVQDLAEGYHRHVTRSGRGSARRWYWWQAVRAIPARLSPRGALFDRDRAWSGTGGRRSSGSGLAVRLAVRLAMRSFMRRPLYAAGVAGTLGLGLGAAAAVFAVAWGIWFRPLPFPDADRVVRVYEVNLRPDGEGENPVMSTASAPSARWNALSPPLLADLQDASFRTVDGFAAVSMGAFDWTTGEGVRRVSALMVSPEIFGLLGVQPVHGRVVSGVAGVRDVVVTEPFWRRAFGSDPSVLDRTMVLDGESYAIVGVIPSPSGYPESADLWVPLVFEESALSEGMRGARYLDAIARVKPGRSVMEASAEIDAFVRGLGEVHPNHRAWGGHAVPVRQELVRPFRAVLITLLVAGAVFVLLAMVNVAGLVAARRAENRHARSIRLALGASHRQILREGIVESTVLGIAGAVVAAAGATWVLAPIKRMMPADVPRLPEVSLGSGMLIGLLLSGVFAGALVGVLGHMMSGVRDRPAVGRNRDAGRPGVRGRRALLVTQVALTTWLLIVGLALIRHVAALRAVDFGFRADGVLSAPLTLSHLRQGEDAQQSFAFWQDVLHRLDARGVTAAVATNPPISGSTMRFGYDIRGDASDYWGQYHAVSPAYFDVIGTDITAGRTFTDADRAGAAPVVIINEALARAHFGNQDPVGRTMHVVETERTIVGVARSTRHFGPDREPPAELYVPLAQDPWPFAHVLIREGAGVTADVLATVVAAVDADLPVPPLVPFERYVSSWFAPFRLQLVIVGMFAAVGTALAALGIYALVAYLVSNRIREIGIRLALGERSPMIFRRVLGNGIAMTSLGALLGVAAAAGTRGVVSRLVTGIDPADPFVVLLVVVIVVSMAALASALPARRAVAVDPMITLRAE